MGAGLVELLAREMTADLQGERAEAVKQARAGGQDVRADLVSKGVRFGSITAHPDGIVDLDSVEGVDADLIVRPFSRKGVFTSLRQFTINALNVASRHGGVGAIRRALDRQPRFRRERRSRRGDARRRHRAGRVPGDACRRRPSRATCPTIGAPPPPKAAGVRALGCASCHRPELPLKSMIFTDPAPYDMAGTLRAGEVKKGVAIDLSQHAWARALPKNDKGEWLIPLFSDLKRHLIVDSEVNALGNELQAQRFVERDVFLTPRLWGVGSTAPYGHRGDFRMLDEIIAAHGGEARFARDAYLALDKAQRDSVIAFLRSLVIEAP